MAEQGNGGHTPPAFAFMDEATAGTNREGGECALGTSDDYPPYVDEYIDDVWKVLNSQNDATDVNDATDSTSTNHAPAESSASAHHFRPSTSYAGVEKVSSTTEDTASGIDVTIIAGFMRTPGVTRRTRKPRRLPKKLATSMVSLTMAALVTCTWRPSAASITQGPAQAVLAWRMHQPVLKTVPREFTFTNATGTGERERPASCVSSRKVSSRRDTSHGQPNKHTGYTAPTFRARDQSSVNKSSHKCETCSKLLSGAFSLTEHYRTHTGERPFKCEICKKSFVHRSSFHKHQQIHTGVKPHICQICTKPFRNKVDLKCHLTSHSSDRPFVCDICNRSFKWKTNLRRHRKRDH